MSQYKVRDTSAKVEMYAGRRDCGCMWSKLGEGIGVIPCGQHREAVMRAIGEPMPPKAMKGDK